MGYYENPPIINLNPGADKIAAGFASGANAIAEALIKRGDRRREEEKEEKLTIKKMQDEKNKIDLAYNDKLSEFQTNLPMGSPIGEQSKILLTKKIQDAADARIALTMETSAEKRSAYMKVIRDADTFMDTAAKFAKNSAMELATYKDTPGIAMNVPGGWAVNASGENVIKRTNTMNIMSGLTQEYESHNIELVDMGGTFAVKVSGKLKNGQSHEEVINASDYLNSDGSGTGGFLQKVENTDEFNKQALGKVADEKGNVFKNFLSEKYETVTLPSGVKDTYKVIGGQRLNTANVMAELEKQADIKAAGYLRADKTASLRALVNYTLEKGPEYYDKEFKMLSVDEQRATLKNILATNAFTKMTSNLEKSYENGQPVYWAGENLKVTMEEKPKATSAGGKTGSPKGSGDTSTQKNQRDFNKRVEELIRTKKGGITKGGFTLGLLDGRWTLYDKDGIPKVGTENITSPSELATYIGYAPVKLP